MNTRPNSSDDGGLGHPRKLGGGFSIGSVVELVDQLEDPSDTTNR